MKKPQSQTKLKSPSSPKESKVELVEFSVTATIPTQSYGNITPKITVKAPTIEEARAVVMPIIEDLYNTYAEIARDGHPPKFINKAQVTVTEKVIVVPKSEVPNVEAPAAKMEPEQTVVKTAPFLNAEGAIKGAMSREALDLVEDAVKKSTKLTAEEKPVLLTQVLYKRKELNNPTK